MEKKIKSVLKIVLTLNYLKIDLSRKKHNIKKSYKAKHNFSAVE